MLGAFFLGQAFLAQGPVSIGFIVPGLLTRRHHLSIAPREPLPIYFW